MKHLLAIPVIAFLLSACSVQSRIIESTDSYKGIETAKMVQFLRARSADRNLVVSNGPYTYLVSFLSEGKNGEEATITMEVKLEVPIVVNPMDTVFYLDLDGEKIKLSPEAFQNREFEKGSTATSTEVSTKTEDNSEKRVVNTQVVNQNYQLMTARFVVPHNLWVSIANSKSIAYRFYLGKEAFDTRLTSALEKRLAYFFQLALSKETQNIPLIPEGKMKW